MPAHYSITGRIFRMRLGLGTRRIIEWGIIRKKDAAGFIAPGTLDTGRGHFHPSPVKLILDYNLTSAYVENTAGPAVSHFEVGGYGVS